MIVADVVHPILGIDFFQDGEGKRLLIDLILFIASTFEECPVEKACSSVYTIPTTSSLTYKWSCITEDADHCAELHVDEYAWLWMDFSEVTDPSMSNIMFTSTPFHFTTEGPLVYMTEASWRREGTG